MAAGETETASAVRAFDGPADRKVIRLLGRTCNDDGRETRIIIPETNPIIVFLLGRERFHATQNRVVRRAQLRLGLPGLNRGIPVVRRGAGLVIEIPAYPFRNLVV